MKFLRQWPNCRARGLLLAVLLAPAAFAAAEPAKAPPSSNPFRITALCHVGFWVGEIEKSRVFYKNVLGFDEPYALTRANGELFVAFIKINDRQTVNLYPDAAKIPPNGDNLRDVGLETDNAAALHDYVITKGIAANPVRQTQGGDLIFALKDPDGHSLEITQYGPDGQLLQNAGKNLPNERIANRLASVSLRVANRGASVAFYRDILGFKEVARTGKGVTGVCLRVPDGDDSIILDSNVPTSPAVPLRAVEQFSIEQTEGSSTKAHTMFFDPDGTRLEIIAPGYSGGPLAKIEPTRTLIYKRIGDRELTMSVFEPKGPSAGKLHPCLLAIHGGGWTSGVPRSMFSFAARAAELGMVGISMQYRLFKSAPGITVYDCVKDGRSAVRYLRTHAVELGIDPDKIAVAGSSAGGHLAAADAVLDRIDETGEDTSVSCIPNAVILMSAVIDTSTEGYGNAKAGSHWEELSPLLHVHSGLPPTLMFHGTGDLTTPFKGAKAFHDAMIAAGNRCELVAMPGASHTYYGKDKALYDTTLHQLEAFLASLGYCQPPTSASAGPAPAAARPARAPPDQVDVFVSGQGGYHTYRIPSVIRAHNGDLLGFCEGRKTAGGDAGDIDLVLKRSTDGGRTWGALQVVWTDDANTCGNPCPVLDESDGTLWLLLTHNLGQDKESAIVARKSAGTRTVWVTHSTDNGATWTVPAEITSTTKDSSWTWYATGPGIGIQIKAGAHAGRLVIPCDHTRDDPADPAGKKPIGGSHAIYSDDHGRTWALGGTIEPKVNECQVAELFDGRGTLLMNMRSGYGHHCRAQSWSSDGGLTWTAPTDAPALIEPGCQASLIRSGPASTGQRGSLLFSNPAAKTRSELTVKVSGDDGATWRTAVVLHSGPAAYSSLVALGNEQAGCLYECGEKNANERISFARFGVGSPP